MANLGKENEKWLVQSLETGKSGFQTELATNGKYLDRNIVVDVKVKDGALAFDKANGKVQVTEGYVDSQDEFTLDAATHANSVSIGESKVFTDTATAYEVTADAKAVVSQGYVKAETSTDAVQAKKYIKAGSVKNVPTDDVTYTEVTAGAVVDNGFLYIDEGYQEAQKISLGTLIPDDVNIGDAAHGAELIYKGITGYDKDGNKITGTMQDAIVSVSAVVDADAVVSAVDADVKADGEGFKVEVKTPIAGTISSDVTQVGYVTAIADSEAVTGSADTTVKLAKAAFSATEGGVVAAKPALSNSTIALSGVTDAAKAGATTDAPTSGVFVKVDASAAAGAKGSATINANVTSAGYAKAGDGVASLSVDTTLADADALYVPIKEGSATVTVNPISVNDGISITGDQTNGYTINVVGSGKTAPTVTEGWIKTIAESDVTVSGATTIQASTIIQEVRGTEFVAAASKGYNANEITTSIPVYQGEIVG